MTTLAAVQRQEQRISRLKVYITDNNPLEIDGNSLQHFVTKCIVPSDTTADIMNTFSAGAGAFAKFASEQLMGEISVWDKMKHLKLTRSSAVARMADRTDQS